MKSSLVMVLMFLISAAYGQSKQKQDTLYYIIGTKPDFILLQQALRSPQDITPRQDSAIIKWIQNYNIIKPKNDTATKK